MAPSKLGTWFPHAKAPVIINAPMLGAAGASLATEVHKAGGVGKKDTISLLGSVAHPPFSLSLSPLQMSLLLKRNFDRTATAD